MRRAAARRAPNGRGAQRSGPLTRSAPWQDAWLGRTTQGRARLAGAPGAACSLSAPPGAPGRARSGRRHAARGARVAANAAMSAATGQYGAAVLRPTAAARPDYHRLAVARQRRAGAASGRSPQGMSEQRTRNGATARSVGTPGTCNTRHYPLQARRARDGRAPDHGSKSPDANHAALTQHAPLCAKFNAELRDATRAQTRRQRAVTPLSPRPSAMAAPGRRMTRA